MSSSKFSSPFLNKSPLYGAYYSGADGMVTVSYDDVHQKFQDGLSQNVAKARAMHDKKSVNNCEGLDDKLLDLKMSSSVHTRAKQICADRKKEEEKPPNTGTDVVVKDNYKGVETDKQNRARYDLPEKNDDEIVNVKEIIKIGKSGLGQPCPPGQYRDPITKMCN